MIISSGLLHLEIICSRRWKNTLILKLSHRDESVRKKAAEDLEKLGNRSAADALFEHIVKEWKNIAKG